MKGGCGGLWLAFWWSTSCDEFGAMGASDGWLDGLWQSCGLWVCKKHKLGCGSLDVVAIVSLRREKANGTL